MLGRWANAIAMAHCSEPHEVGEGDERQRTQHCCCQKKSEGAAMAPISRASIRIDPRRVIKGELGDEVSRLNAPPPH